MKDDYDLFDMFLGVIVIIVTGMWILHIIAVNDEIAKCKEKGGTVVKEIGCAKVEKIQ